MDLGFKTLALTALLSSSLSLSQAAFSQTQPQPTPADQQAVPRPVAIARDQTQQAVDISGVQAEYPLGDKGRIALEGVEDPE